MVLGLTAAGAVLASEMPRLAAWPLAACAIFHGLRLAHRYRRAPHQAVWFPGEARDATVDGERMAQVRVRWRGPLAFVSWRTPTGERRHLAWWPDTLPPEARRELRLAAPVTGAGRRGAGMAP